MQSHDGLYYALTGGGQVGFLINEGVITECHPKGKPLMGKPFPELLDKCSRKGYILERYTGGTIVRYEPWREIPKRKKPRNRKVYSGIRESGSW